MGISKLASQILSWAGTIYVARILDPTDYGLIGMCSLFMGVITLVGDFGLNASIIQKKQIELEELSSLFWQFVLMGGSIATFIYFAAPLACKFWDQPELLNLIRVSALTFFITTIFQLPTALMQKNMRFKAYSLILAFASLIGMATTVILVTLGIGVISIILGTLVMTVVQLILLFWFQPFRPKLVFKFKDTITHLKMGSTITTERYLWWYYSNIDFWLASKFISTNSYGAYSMAFQLASLPVEKIASVTNPVTYPNFCKMDTDEERKTFYLKLSRYLACLCCPIFFILFWTADDLIVLVLGNKWFETIEVIKILALIFPLRCIATLNSPLLMSIRRVDVSLKNTAFGAVLATVCFAIGVSYGITGLAYSWLAFYPFFFLFSIYNISNVINLPIGEYIYNLRKIILNIILMSLSMYCFKSIFNLSMPASYSELVIQISRFFGTALTGATTFVIVFILTDLKTAKNLYTFLCEKIFSRRKSPTVIPQ